MSTKSGEYSKEQLENFEKWWKQLSKKIEVSDVSGPTRAAPPRLDKTIRFKPALWPVPPEELKKNLEKYRKLALDLGAADAKIIPSKEIPQDLRSLYVGCLFPNCRWLNTNFHCPMVNNFPYEEMKEFLSDFKFALVFKVIPPTIDSIPDVGEVDLDMYYTMGGGPPPDKAMLARNIIRLRILAEMERRIRSAAYYDGYMMAAPIGSGPCIVSKCADLKVCPALKRTGICRSVEAQPNGPVVFIDYFALGCKLGWGPIQVGGNCAFPEDTPNPQEYYNIGLILID